MDNNLQLLAGQIRDEEYQDLFPETPVQEAKNNPEKVKEAAFQVHGVIWNKELYQYAQNNGIVEFDKLEELAENKEQVTRIKKGMGAITMIDDAEGYPSRDILYSMTKKTALWD